MNAEIERHSGGSSWEDQAGYCRAIRAGGWVLVSGTAAKGLEGDPLSALDTYAQTRQALESALESAERLGATRYAVLRTRVSLDPSANWPDAAKAHAEFFGDSRPTNTTVYVGGLIPDGALVEVEIDAWIGKDPR